MILQYATITVKVAKVRDFFNNVGQNKKIRNYNLKILTYQQYVH